MITQLPWPYQMALLGAEILECGFNVKVDLYQLQVSALRRYKRHYKIQTRQGVNKAQLAETLSRHFKTIPVNEKEAITYFVYMVKNNKNKLDQKNGNETSGT
ncbi:histone deacetylase complex subunit SAP30L [Trichonephila inaurata madagascariensis]|uniref:Histone deacetylase complex subunit SAP30L n=1 Tax=Trichonephila inaurata madagascariensis TaxID=2747483 RepID=A0A8X7C540_9ARAC|nr:histone deacetylase complex subunit SAP30L [Trichonephila inaurata madagascariensis]